MQFFEGLAFHAIGDPDEAIRHYRSAIAINEKEGVQDAEIHFNFGVSLDHVGDILPAAEQYNQVFFHNFKNV